MFVSSYNTYLSTHTDNKTTKNKQNYSTSKLFEINLNKNEVSNPNTTLSSPINYISKYKTLSVKERINSQLKQETAQSNMSKFSSVNSQIKAPMAYAANSTMFSLMIKYPKTAKQIEDNSDRVLKEPTLRTKMIDTYMANDKYYQLTA
ncbi:MAG: hypothetical protein OQJ77_05465 [Thiovulaceae bacterium]|nr:hypothetical protein [Sulfurimonadaceae bacterium]MCW9026745.1 hypothetical protein [Sulfurimonadaceae bacterium]